MLHLRTLLSLAALAVVLCALRAGAMPTEGREEASPALQQLLLKDKAFMDEQRANGTLKLDTIHGNTAYNYAVATKLFWHSVSDNTRERRPGGDAPSVSVAGPFPRCAHASRWGFRGRSSVG